MKLYSLVTFLFTLFVIVWGALVRASNSGAGCGKNWPLCQNELLPSNLPLETIIELTHRVTSGLSFVLVCFLFILSRKNFTSQSLPRVTASYALVFMLLEVAIGAVLVLFGWVKDDSSNYRIFMVAFHLINSFLLIGSLGLHYFAVLHYPELKLKRALFLPSRNSFTLVIILLLLTSCLGAVTALSDTLYPAEMFDLNFSRYLYHDNLLIKLRIFHPLIALLSSFVLCAFSIESILKYPPQTQINQISKLLISLIFVQFLLGLLTIVFLIPLMLQLLHLLISLILWISTLILIMEREFHEN